MVLVQVETSTLFLWICHLEEWDQTLDVHSGITEPFKEKEEAGDGLLWTLTINWDRTH